MAEGCRRPTQLIGRLRVILIEGATNSVVLLAKLAVGLTTGSLAILSDALHSLTDVANNILACSWSAMPPDRLTASTPMATANSRRWRFLSWPRFWRCWR